MNWKNWEADEAVALVVMAVIEAVTLFYFFREKSAKDRAERELKEIKRRGDAPYFAPCDKIFGQLYFNTEKDGVHCWLDDSGNVLCYMRGEVENSCPPGTPVIFVVENLGEQARSVNVKLDGEEIAFKQEADINNANGLQFFEYPYQSEKRGKEQTISISFETRNGVQDVHRYVTRHGFRILQRIDPALPQ